MAFTPSQVDLTTSSNNSRLNGWLASVLEVISVSDEEAELQLSHLGDENPRMVRTFRFRPDSDTDDIAMAQTIEQVATDDAEHLPAGSQHYSSRPSLLVAVKSDLCSSRSPYGFGRDPY